MTHLVRMAAATASMALALTFGAGMMTGAHADDTEGRDIPPAFSSFEYLVGRWNGQAIPKDSAQSFRGWPEKHIWAWIFTAGKPTALSLAIEGGKVLADGKLTYDAARKRFRLEGTAPKPRGGAIAFEGAFDASGKMLVLDQVAGAAARGRDAGAEVVRLSIRPNSNFIRYTMWVDRKEAGSTQFSRSIEVGLTKEGESLAGGTTASDRPKCIVTGGAAAMTITYNGQTFPICCTGCRDEFNESPEKYIKKASLMAQSRGTKKAGQPAPTRVGRFEDAFSGDVADAPAMKRADRPTAKAAPGSSQAKAESSSEADADESKAASKGKSAKKDESKGGAAAPPMIRAASLLRIGQNLEKNGKNDAALEYYKRVVKDYGDTPSAKTARQRIKAIEKP
jgi:YHS domain-containing protein